MFELRCIVGDKKLSDALRALKGHTIEHPVVIPVDDVYAPTPPSAPSANGAAKATFKKRQARKPFVQGGNHNKGLGATQVVRDLIAKSGATQVSAREMKQATLAVGYRPGAYSNALKILLRDKTLRKLGFGDYEVLKPTRKAE